MEVRAAAAGPEPPHEAAGAGENDPAERCRAVTASLPRVPLERLARLGRRVRVYGSGGVGAPQALPLRGFATRCRGGDRRSAERRRDWRKLRIRGGAGGGG